MKNRSYTQAVATDRTDVWFIFQTSAMLFWFISRKRSERLATLVEHGTIVES